MVLTDKQKRELEDAIELMARKKKLMLAAKGTSYHARAKENLLWALGLVNTVLRSFETPTEWRGDFKTINRDGSEVEERSIWM